MKDYILNFAKELLAIDSPSGFTKEALNFVEKEAKNLGYTTTYTNKGNGIIDIKGKDESKTIGVAAHIDTLGAMVKTITGKGTLKVTPIGGPNWTFLNGEYCTVYTREGKKYRGTILSTTPSTHVDGAKSTDKITVDSVEVRLDEVVKTKADTQKLGIENGCFVCFDTRTEISDSGYIKSRFLDDKISVAILFGLLKKIKENKLTPKCNIKILFSTYEEVGHGTSYIPSDITEMIAVDMGCIGNGLECTEHDVSICAKDSSGPYDYEITTTLSNLAKKNKINHAVDIYPYYGSDVSAALRGGNDIKGGLIGPGVYASHGVERTHADGLIATLDLLVAYLF